MVRCSSMVPPPASPPQSSGRWSSGRAPLPSRLRTSSSGSVIPTARLPPSDELWHSTPAFPWRSPGCSSIGVVAQPPAGPGCRHARAHRRGEPRPRRRRREHEPGEVVHRSCCPGASGRRRSGLMDLLALSRHRGRRRPPSRAGCSRPRGTCDVSTASRARAGRAGPRATITEPSQHNGTGGSPRRSCRSS
jgi:hypothetical protein